jgi:hypothetical protein
MYGVLLPDRKKKHQRQFTVNAFVSEAAFTFSTSLSTLGYSSTIKKALRKDRPYTPNGSAF